MKRRVIQRIAEAHREGYYARIPVGDLVEPLETTEPGKQMFFWVGQRLGDSLYWAPVADFDANTEPA